MPFSIAIVEDDALIRASWVKIVTRAGYRCVGDFGSAEAALAGLPQEPPDFVLMDIHLPGMNGVDCTREIKRRLPQIDVVMLTTFDDRDNLFEALRAGASGYLLKRTTPTALVAALAELKAGGAPMSPQIARQVVQFFRTTAPPASAAPTGVGRSATSVPTTATDAAEVTGTTPAEGLENLSARENEILRCLAEGRPYKEIADQLGLSLDTVRTYVRRVYAKLQVHSRTDAVVKYLGR